MQHLSESPMIVNDSCNRPDRPAPYCLGSHNEVIAVLIKINTAYGLMIGS